MFPSPYGDFVFQRADITNHTRKHSSRFRPLTGILFFNACRFIALERATSLRFPSPYGDFVFQLRLNVFRAYADFPDCFRPLTGILFFNESYGQDVS